MGSSPKAKPKRPSKHWRLYAAPSVPRQPLHKSTAGELTPGDRHRLAFYSKVNVPLIRITVPSRRV